MINAGKSGDAVDDYILTEVAKNGQNPRSDEQHSEYGSQRILSPNELILDSVARWNGSTKRFVIRKKGAVRSHCIV